MALDALTDKRSVLYPAPGESWRAATLLVVAGLSLLAPLRAQTPAPITAAQRLRTLTPEEAAQSAPVRLRGVVTFSNGERLTGFVQDASAGVFVKLTPDQRELRPGELVEIQGRTSPCGFAPCVVEARARKLGEGPMPRPIRPSFRELFSGRPTSQWGELEGVVRAGRANGSRLVLALHTGAAEIPVIVEPYPERWESLWVDAEVRAQGVLGATFNARRQVSGARLRTPGERFVEVVDPPISNPFDGPLTPLAELGAFRTVGRFGRRLRTHGVVMAVAGDDTLYLHDRGGTASVVTRAPTAARPGVRVEVVGFYEGRGGRPAIEHALVRVIGHGTPPPPTLVEPDESLTPELHMAMVRVRGEVVRATRWDRGVLLQSGAQLVMVRLPEGLTPETAGVGEGAVVEVTGLCLLPQDPEEQRASFRILTRSLEDVVVLEQPPWLTLERVLWALGALLACAAAIAAWGASLRRRVASQTAQIRKAIESEAELEGRYQRLFERNLAALLRLSSKGRILDCNLAGARLLGYETPEAVVGSTVRELCSYPEFAGVLLKPKPDQGPQEVCLQRAGGGVVWALAGVALAEGDSGDGPVSEVTLLDITRQRESEKQILEAKREAEAANQAKSEFLANMSHEVRTPLNGILGMTKLALEGELSTESREYLNLSVYSAELLLDIVNEVLDFSKIEARKVEIEIVAFDPRSVFGKAVRSLEPRAEEKGMELRIAISADVPPKVAADPTRLRQVLLNLVSNAIKFTDQGEVAVSIRVDPTSEARLLFEVSDTGIGVPPDKREAIFEPFRQADGCTTRQYGGTGLGLAVCSRLVELMGGRIWLDERPGGGSRFQFTARFEPAEADIHDEPEPVAATPELTSEPRSESSAALSILVAEDNPVNRLLAVRLLERAGHATQVVENGADAVRALAHERFDLVLMDVQMPVMDGLAATRAIRASETNRHTPIVALTAHAMTGDDRRCFDAGMDGYLTKPIDPDKLIEAIEFHAGLAQTPV